MPGFVVVGDIHGCLVQLREVLTLAKNFADHQLVFLGDYIDRGPDSEGVIRLLRTLPATFLRGNHEQMLLDRMGSDSGRNARFLIQAGLSPESAEWIRSQTIFLEETEDYVFVHAGFDIRKPLHAQTEDDLVWTRYEGSYERLTTKLVVHGHSIVDRPDKVGNRLNINTGCGAGGPLTALALPEMKFLVSSASPGPEYNLAKMRKYLEGELEEL